MSDHPDNVERGPQLSDELKRFAADLARLQPRDDRLDRERLAFLAGQASVAGSKRPARVLGLPLASRAWPAAFASMTAVAAALLFALLARPEIPAVRPAVARGSVYEAAPQLVMERRDDSGMLSTRDASLGNVEARLRERERKQAGTDTSSSPVDDRKTPVLTPNAWHQVMNESETLQPSLHDASGLLQREGVNS